MANKPFPFSVCEECCLSGGSDGLTETDVVEIIRNNAQNAIDEDITLPPSTQYMMQYIESMPFSEDVEALRQELYNYYVSKDEFDNAVKYTDSYINHDMRIKNLELYNQNELAATIDAITQDLNNIHVEIGDLEAGLDNIIAIQNSLIGGENA